MRLGLRYDLRSPSFGASAPELWAAALDQFVHALVGGMITLE